MSEQEGSVEWLIGMKIIDAGKAWIKLDDGRVVYLTNREYRELLK